MAGGKEKINLSDIMHPLYIHPYDGPNSVSIEKLQGSADCILCIKKGLRRSVLPLRESWGLWLGWLQEIKKILKSKTNGTLVTILSSSGFMGLSQNKSKNPLCILIQVEKYAASLEKVMLEKWVYQV